MTPEQAKLRARRAAYFLHARYDAREITAGARAAFLRRFEREVDPDLRLTAQERHRRAVYALKAHMTGLALASARVRGARRAKSLGISSNKMPNYADRNTTSNGTAEACNPGRSNQGAADRDGRPLHTA